MIKGIDPFGILMAQHELEFQTVETIQSTVLLSISEDDYKTSTLYFNETNLSI